MSRQNHVVHAHIAKKKQLTLFDKVIILAAFMYPLSGLPQVIEVFSGHAVGVSLWSWVSFLAFSTLFLAYGLIHKITPMIITNILWLAIDGLVIVGLLFNSKVI
jgi:hypothetical protein